MMSPQQPLISIITVNYNGVSDTLELIDSLKQLSYTNWELIVVDNASEEDPKSKILAKLPNCKVLVLPENLGFAGGNNKGIEIAEGSYCFFVNNDTWIVDGCLETLVKTASELPNLGAISPKFQFYHDKGTIEFAGCTKINRLTARNGALHHGEKDTGITGLIKTHYAHGAGMLVPMDIIKKVGPMLDDYFLYYEEMDWCERIRRSGYDIYCQRDALIYHKESATVGKLNPLKTYYLNRNRIWFMLRNYPFPRNVTFLLFLCFISFPVNVLRFSINREWDHLKAYTKGVFWHLNHNLTY